MSLCPLSFNIYRYLSAFLFLDSSTATAFSSVSSSCTSLYLSRRYSSGWSNSFVSPGFLFNYYKCLLNDFLFIGRDMSNMSLKRGIQVFYGTIIVWSWNFWQCFSFFGPSCPLIWALFITLRPVTFGVAVTCFILLLSRKGQHLLDSDCRDLKGWVFQFFEGDSAVKVNDFISFDTSSKNIGKTRKKIYKTIKNSKNLDVSIFVPCVIV